MVLVQTVFVIVYFFFLGGGGGGGGGGGELNPIGILLNGYKVIRLWNEDQTFRMAAQIMKAIPLNINFCFGLINDAFPFFKVSK